MKLARYSEPYQATGGLAAEGVINQLGRPDIEPLEVLVREAVQNCWDARRESEQSIRVEIGRRELDADTVEVVRDEILVDAPPDLALADALRTGMEIVYFADFGTAGLGGPTRADEVVDGAPRDFVDFARNIGQPPDKDFGGGSFGYGKAAFYVTSRARTVIVDTLCEVEHGLERRLIGAALGTNHTQEGRAYTGRHWWGTMIDGVPEPVTGAEAARIAKVLGLPDRDGRDGLGTTIAIIAPDLGLEDEEGPMGFIAETVVWNFWPKMVSTRGGVQATIDFRLYDNGGPVRLPDPRTHPRLRGFVEAMDRLRADPSDDDDDATVIDRQVASERPIKHLGRVVIQKGPVAPPEPGDVRALTQGARATARGMHHVALMRNAELVVKYLAGPEPAIGRFGYAGVFRCSLDTDEAFRNAEPPTHDDWIARAVPERRQRVFVNVALDRIRRVCREAAGYGATVGVQTEGADVPLGEFADGLARLMPAFEGPGARRASRSQSGTRRRKNAPGARRSDGLETAPWVDAAAGPGPGVEHATEAGGAAAPANTEGETPPLPRPALRVAGEPEPSIATDGTPVMRYPFELRGNGNVVRLSATVQVMTNDGESLESDPPRGWVAPEARTWIDSTGAEHTGRTVELAAAASDGAWTVEIPIVDDMVLGVDITAEVLV